MLLEALYEALRVMCVVVCSWVCCQICVNYGESPTPARWGAAVYKNPCPFHIYSLRLYELPSK